MRYNPLCCYNVHSYTLGAIMACQFFEAAKRDIPQLEDKLARGEFAPLKQWLNKVH
jgi:carboxypeptidase Taq